jgi:putative spermidine/putrescine transport system substrate-binding protein
MRPSLDILCGAVFSAMLSTSAMAQTDVTIVTWGGNIAKQMMDAWFVPATKGLGVNILEDSLKSSNDIAAHVAAGNTDWDVVDAATDMCERGGRAGILEELDFNVVKTEGLPPAQITRWSVPSTAYTTVLAYNKKTYGDHPPRNWKDFFDVENFPGSRFFGPFPAATLEIALLADGVAPDKLYPLDVDRAFRKLKQFSPNITGFAATFGVATQMITDGEADMIFLPDNRLFAALKAGANYGYTYDQGIMNFDCLVIPKGSKHRDLAMKIIAGIVSPEINARIVEASGLSPSNLLSIEKGFVPAKLVPELATAPQNLSKVILANNGWWAQNRDKLQLNERYNEFKAR